MSTKKQKQNIMSTPMTGLFGPHLLSNLTKTESTNTILKNKDLVLLYFSASWCPPCQSFTPTLAEFYKTYCIPHNIEIVYVSSDRDIPSFNEYYGGKMPWKSIPPMDTVAIKSKLANDLRISGIPALIVLDAKTGNFVSDTARDDVMVAAGSGSKEQCEELVRKWKDADAVPIEEAQFSGSGPPGLVWYVVLLYVLCIYSLSYVSPP
jgi:nucleoredoxin